MMELSWSHTTNDFYAGNIEGMQVNGLATDVSGDVYAVGQTSWNKMNSFTPLILVQLLIQQVTILLPHKPQLIP